LNWRKFVSKTPEKVNSPRLASKVSNSFFVSKGTKTLYGLVFE